MIAWIRLPARQTQAIERAHADPEVVEQHLIMAVRQYVELRHLGAAGHAPAFESRGVRGDLPILVATAPSNGCGGSPGHLLEEKIHVAGHARVGVKTPHHGSILERVVQRGQDHALVMAHVGEDDVCAPRVGVAQPEVHGLEESEAPEHFQAFEGLEVRYHALRKKRQGKQRCIGCNHQSEALLSTKTQPWYAECAVLIVGLRVELIKR